MRAASSRRHPRTDPTANACATHEHTYVWLQFFGASGYNFFGYVISKQGGDTCFGAAKIQGNMNFACYKGNVNFACYKGNVNFAEIWVAATLAACQLLWQHLGLSATKRANASLNCGLSKYHFVGATIGASLKDYSVKVAGTGLLAVSHKKKKRSFFLVSEYSRGKH